MASKSNSLLVVIPVYNESKIISYTIERVVAELDKIKIKSGLLIVDDGSHDNSGDIVTKLKKKYPKKLRLAKHTVNKGYGAAIQTGIRYGLNNNYSYSLFMDSDLTNDPRDIERFAEQIRYGYDCVKGSRYIEGGDTVNIPKKRIIMSRIGNTIAYFMFGVGVKDCTNGFLMIKLQKFNKIRLKEKGFAVIMEEMYYLKKKRALFKEIPVTLRSRKTGSSNFKYSIPTFYSYIKYPVKSIWL